MRLTLPRLTSEVTQMRNRKLKIEKYKFHLNMNCFSLIHLTGQMIPVVTRPRMADCFLNPLVKITGEDLVCLLVCMIRECRFQFILVSQKMNIPEDNKSTSASGC